MSDDHLRRRARPAVIVVRRAVLGDAGAIAAVHVQSWRIAYQGIVPDAYLRSLSEEMRAAKWRQSLTEGTCQVYVAEEGGQVRGWIGVAASRDPDAGPSTGELWAIYVDPGHWGRGIGRLLWDRGLSWLKGAGFSEVTLWALEDNRRAVRFYRSVGFDPRPDQDKVVTIGGADLREIRLRLRGRANPPP